MNQALRKQIYVICVGLGIALVLMGIGWFVRMRIERSMEQPQSYRPMVPTDTPHVKGPTAPPPGIQ